MSFIRLLLVLAALGSASAAQAQEKFTVLLDWFINPDHAPLVIAQQRGYFTAQGLDVELVEPADPNAPPKLVAAGQGDVAISYQPQLYLQRAAGLPLRAIGVVVDQPLNSLVVLKDGPIQSIADLEGKKVGYSVGGFETALLGQMLQAVDVSEDSVELINVNFALTPALISGQVDAVIGAFRNFELNQLILNQAEGMAFFPEDEGVPTYDELIVVAAEDRLADDELLAFMWAMQKAATDIHADPEGTWEVFKAYKDGLDDDLNRMAWKDTVPLLAKNVLALDAAKYKSFGEFMESRGLIDEVLSVEDYIAPLGN